MNENHRGPNTAAADALMGIFKLHRISPTHKSEVEAIRKLITALGGRFNLTHQGGRLRGSAGIPDIYCQFPLEGIRFFVEVKVGRDKLSAAQADFAGAESTCKGTVIVGGVAEVIDYLKVHNFRIESIGEKA